MLGGFFLSEGKRQKLGKPVFATLSNDGMLRTYKVGALRGKLNLTSTEMEALKGGNGFTFHVTRRTASKSKTYFINAPNATIREGWIESLKEVKKYGTAHRKKRNSMISIAEKESERRGGGGDGGDDELKASSVSVDSLTTQVSSLDDDEAGFDSGDEDDISLRLKSLDLKHRSQSVAARTMQLSNSIKKTKDTQAISECESWTNLAAAISGVMEKAPSISYAIGSKSTSTKKRDALKRRLQNVSKWEQRFISVGLDFTMRYYLVKEISSINVTNCKVILSEKKHEGGCDLYRNKLHITHKNGSVTLDLIAATMEHCNEWVDGIKCVTKQVARKLANSANSPDNKPFIVAKAWMFKRGAQMWTGWRRRYFVLHSTRELLYYETDTGSTMLGHIELGSHCVVKKANKTRDAPYPKGGLDIQTPGRTYKLCLETDDKNEVTKWISLLTESGMHYQEHIAKLRKNLEEQTGISREELQRNELESNNMMSSPRRNNPSKSRPEYLALHRTQSAVVVAPLNSWQRWSGNVPIGVLSESPWSALIIAQSLQTPRHTHALSDTGKKMSMQAKKSMASISDNVKEGGDNTELNDVDVTIVNDSNENQEDEKDTARESHFDRNTLNHVELPSMAKVSISDNDRDWLTQKNPHIYKDILALEEANKILREELAFAKAENQHLRFSNVRLQGALLKSVRGSNVVVDELSDTTTNHDERRRSSHGSKTGGGAGRKENRTSSSLKNDLKEIEKEVGV